MSRCGFVAGGFHGSGFVTLAVLLLPVMGLAGCASAPSHPKFSADEFHEAACSVPAPADAPPWHIATLYDCSTRTLYVPYQLWTGAAWDGNRDAPCMHEANSHFNVDNNSPTTITGPVDYVHPGTGVTHQVWSRDKVNGSKKQLFSCHEKGIGRLFDSRRNRVYAPGRCKFPAGEGWPINEKRDCLDTSVRITSVRLNADMTLAALRFDWWFGTTHDHTYQYVPDYGMTNAWRQQRFGN